MAGPSLPPHGAALPPAPEVALAGRVLEFVRQLRAEHFRVGVQESADALRVAEHLGLAQRQPLCWGWRALLCSQVQEWKRFDELFDRYWRSPDARGVQLWASGRVARPLPGLGADDSVQAATPPAAVGRGPEPLRAVGASDREASRSDFRLSQLNQDTRELECWIEALAQRLRRRLLRRHRIGHAGRQVHLRRTLRRSLAHGGQPLELVYRQRRRELPRLVLITDVSRSMNVYSYFFLRFARGIIDAFRDADAFVFHTRLLHVTDALRERDAHRLKEKLAWIAAGWGGGTRIGACLRDFNTDFARRCVDSRTFVFVVSDGYDTGEPALLGEQMRLLARRARRLIWLNPLLGRPDYEPIAAGMQAALPHVDVFASVHNLESLMRIEDLLARL